MGIKNILSIVSLAFTLAACTGNGRGDDSAVKDAVDSFACAYFNYDFKKARPYVTPESEKYLRFAASNVLKEDIELLRAQAEGAKHEVEEIRFTSDTTAVARCRIENYLKRDTLGRAGRIINKGVLNIQLVIRNEKWLVEAGSVCCDVPTRYKGKP